MSIPALKLNTGALMPAIGLGVSAGRSKQSRSEAQNWVQWALESGYRHIDTAWIYRTEKAVGHAIRASGILRPDVFVTTKLPWHHASRVEESINDSLQNTGLQYFDLYLMHFPQVAAYKDNSFDTPENPRDFDKILDKPTLNEVWADMEKVLISGKVKAIGVSNFSIKTLEQLLTTAVITPAVNQVELHPYLAQKELVAYCQGKGIAVTAYTPTGKETVRADPIIVDLAATYNVSAAQIILAWHIERGTAAVPKSANRERQRENINLPKLSTGDIESINALDHNERIANKAGPDGKMLGWTYEQLGW
ncbi:hypothetical protein PILCRDRAFT_767712 [Piloderma croceum F 1598]|uniref:NADP-dependent oxidoreductase domain-containing protein n=1 Tax=Piloderma croceum (strain F 1598) TaxID=765440 RepID=A0A0C3GEB3_PILCF|nr:hypothetical protein PILCRDRAFT_767712 [Piloderma croceum F 1598]